MFSSSNLNPFDNVNIGYLSSHAQIPTLIASVLIYVTLVLMFLRKEKKMLSHFIFYCLWSMQIDLHVEINYKEEIKLNVNWAIDIEFSDVIIKILCEILFITVREKESENAVYSLWP